MPFHSILLTMVMIKYCMNALTELSDTGYLFKCLDALGLSTFLTDRNLSIRDCNQTVYRKLGYRKDEIIGLNINHVIAAPELRTSFLNSSTHVFDGRCLRKNREVFSAKITVIPADEGFTLIIEDITNILKIAQRATQRRREINTYNSLSQILSQPRQLRELNQSVLETLVSTLNVDGAWIYLLKDSTEELELCCYKGKGEEVFNKTPFKPPYEQFARRVLSAERPLLVRDAKEDPRIMDSALKSPGFRTIAGVPLQLKRLDEQPWHLVGVLGVGKMQPHSFSSLDMQFLSTIGNHLAVAIENVRLVENLREKMKQIQLINEIGSLVNSSLSIGHIFRLVASELRGMLSFDRASINIIDEQKERQKIFALDTKLKTRLTKGLYAPLDGTSSGWTALNQRPFINRDLKKEIQFPLDRRLLEEGIRSTISIPLYKDRPLGTLNLDSTEPEKYSEKDLEILLPISKHLSIALENALLFEEITREKRQWEKTFDAITDLVWIEDLEGRVLRVNKTVIEKSGKPELSLIKKDSSEILKLLNIPASEPSSAEQAGDRKRFYKELTDIKGTAYHYWTYPLIDSDGRVYGRVNYLRDVTEQKRLEQELIRADKLASLGTLIAGVAHEINNPLGIIAGYSEALIERAKDEELLKTEAFSDFPEYLETINREIFRCKNILSSLLDFARPSSGTKRLINLNELIKEVILLVNHRAKKLNHRIKLDLSESVDELYADPGSLRQMFMNIIMNSLYFMKKRGKVTITTRLEKRGKAKRVIVKIKDNGVGIKKEDLPRVFDPFFTTKPIGEGTGLGLSICHRIVTEHKGTIDVESTPGKGTTFIIALPVMH
ncbi:MAG: GAF domain-containing protein [Nitrospirae bacterium]|nr:MAG: GAF domain-containing protein [Nitrospirota bacterium]